MAEGDDVSNKKSLNSLDNDELSDEKEQDTPKLDISVNSETLNSNEQTAASSGPTNSFSSKGSGTRKEENPFSFRHFLKRDLSLPGNSTYEHTGARPKVYANTVQHSPTKIDIHNDPKRDKIRVADTQAKELVSDGKTHRISDIPSNNSLEISFNVGESTESKHSLYNDGLEEPVYRLNMAAEPLGMPSLPDFVQDHILVEQVYLNSNGPISVDLDNLPDFTFNTNYNASPSLSSGRRHNLDYSSNRNYDYELGAASASNGIGPSPLDLPSGAGAGGSVPLDLPPHLSLDLTESVNPVDRRNVSPGSACPLDLPSNAGAESMRLPDFLPVHPGRTSPEPEHADEQLQSLFTELERARSELFAERSRRTRLESELESARAETEALRGDISAIRSSEAALRARLNDHRPDGSSYADGNLAAGGSQASGSRVHSELSGYEENACRATEADLTISRLRNQIKNLKEELSLSRLEARRLRETQRGAAHALRHATDVAGVSLRDLLAGLEQLRSISSSLEPT